MDTPMHQSEAIAIIGLSCRFPGARNKEEFWQNLKNGVEAITQFSDEELITSGISPEDFNDPAYVRTGHIIEDVDKFDASFFGYSPKEAEITDPQHRLFLECAWEALEDAGYAPRSYEGVIGVYASARMSTYLFNMGFELKQLGTSKGFQILIGNDKDYIASRVSYKLGLTGPSVMIQSACSSSLVAVHLACEDLLNGTCDLILAGGVAVTIPQKMGYLYQEGMIFSPDGRCRAFDADANGMSGGNGVGVVALKRLDDALNDADHIYAIIRGTATNNDASEKIGYTAPSVSGQSAVMSEALRVAEVEPETISYIECHGTGTSLGDPIEIEALRRIFRNQTKQKKLCAVGSVKTNIGHLDTAAGVASLIKTALALEHGELVPSLNFKKANPHIDFENSPFYVNTELSQWKRNEVPRRAGVSSFGIGGTNAHVVLEEAPDGASVNIEFERPLQLLRLSAKSENALKKLAERYVIFLKNRPDFSLEDICFTANAGRSHFPYRACFVAKSVAQLENKLEAFASGMEVIQEKTEEAAPLLVFLFTGQGAQYSGMGKKLYEIQPTFRENIDRCSEILKTHMDRPLLPLIFEEDPYLDITAYTQPSLFAFEYALAQMWMSWGIYPNVVMGHSVGEYVAACVAGVFNLEDGLNLIASRARLIGAQPLGGKMASVFAGKEMVIESIAGYEKYVSIAAINGPEHVVISGKGEVVDKVLNALEQNGISTYHLNISHAFHSPLMDPVLHDFEEIAGTVAYSSPKIKLVSNLTGGIIGKEVCMARYWRDHIRQPVLFKTGIESLSQYGINIFLEIGPKPTLLGMGKKCLPKEAGLWLPTLKKGKDDWVQIIETTANLYVRGLDSLAFDRDYHRKRVSLPTYPFERKRYWIERPREKQKPLIPEWKNLVEAGKIQSRKAIPQPGLSEYRDNVHHLRSLYAAYANLAFQYLGAFQDAKEAYSVQELIKAFQIPANYRQLVFRLLEKLIEHGQLDRDGDRYANLTPVSEGELPALLEKAKSVSLFSENSRLVEIIRRCGENLGRVISGDKNPMEVIFPKGSFDFVESLYEDNRISCYFHLIARKIVQAIVQSSGVPLNILEIGAGTGATSAFVLPVLPQVRTRYVFTDISLIFLDRAKEKLKDYSFVEYGILDIEKDPRKQGFDGHGFDIVLAANVFHATRDLNKTMFNVRSLLAPGGILLIREITENTLVFDITFGPLLTELIDEELRGGWPCLSEEKWTKLIKASDFNTVAIFPESGAETEVLGEHILMARASSKTDAPRAFEGKQLPAQGLGACRAIPVDHPLLGQRLHSPLTELQFESQLSIDLLPFLKDHRIYDMVVVPGTVFIEMATAAAEEFFGTASIVLEVIVMHEALILSKGNASRTVQLILFPESSDKTSFKIFSIVEPEEEQPVTWRLHALGNIRTEKRNEDASSEKHLSLEASQKRCREEVSVTEFYNNIVLDHGVFYGPTFRGIKNLWRREGEALGEIQLQETLVSEANVYRIHPAMLDACLQVLGIIVPTESSHIDTEVAYMPVGLERVWFYSKAPKRLWCHAVMRPDQSPNRETFTVDFTLFDLAGQVIGEVVGLCMKRAHQETLQRAWATHGGFNDHFYEIKWQPKASIKSKETLGQLRPDQPGNWVIFADQCGVGQALAELLEDCGETYDMVFADGGQCHIPKEGPCRIDPSNPEDFIQLFQQRLRDHVPSCRGIVHLWSLDAETSEALTTDSLKTAQLLGCGSVLHLVQAIVKNGWMKPPRLCLVTQGAQSVGAESNATEVAQAPLWGLSRVIAKEHPELNCLIVDMDSLGKEENEIQALCKQIMSEDNENEVVFRNRVRYVPKLVRSSYKASEVEASMNFCSDSTYLITGGLGGIGLEVSRWMADCGAKHLVLLGRKDPSDNAIEVLTHLKKVGVQVMVVRADVSDQERLAETLEEIRVSMPPLRGIFHLAGVLDDCILLQQDWERFVRVMSPKVQGAWNLHFLAHEVHLDFLVFFSSMASVFGSPGQGNHAAANAFLDALATHRESQRLPALSINWGVWSKVGSAVKYNLGDRLSQQGLATIDPQKGLALLGLAMSYGVHQLAAIDVDWHKFLQQFTMGNEPLFLSELLPKVKAQPRVKNEESLPKNKLISQLRKTSLGQREELLEHYMKQKVAQVLHLDIDHVTKDKDFLQMGMDSLMLLELAQVMGKELQIKIKPAKFFEDRTIQVIAKRFANDIVSELAPNQNNDLEEGLI
ncbi:MAG: SDR family NAD(P)-dependent oxidoreductase [Proteobacteria bacterium]|nr:SDR family NAD(P)-dependent oxidoreductase [Pseudomonadota bacterium]